MSTDLLSHRFGAQIDITWMVLKLVNMATGWQHQWLILRLHDILTGDPPSPFTQVSQDSHDKMLPNMDSQSRAIQRQRT